TRAMTDGEKQKESALSAAVAKFDTQFAKEGSKARSELLLERTKSAAALDEFHETLYKAHPKLRLERAEFQSMSNAQLAELVRDNETALVEFAVTPAAAYVFAVS